MNIYKVDFIHNEKSTYITVKMIEYRIIKTIKCLYEMFFDGGCFILFEWSDTNRLISLY